MKRFFKNLALIFLGGIASAVFLFLIIVIIMALITAGSKRPFKTEPESVYTMKLNKPINERSPETIFDQLNLPQDANQATIGLNDILKNIEKAGSDDNIEGIFLDLSIIQAGMATVAEIRNALERFKEKGKFIVAFGDILNKKAYYLATVADEIYLNPIGVLEFTGLKSEIIFFKGTFEKLGIEPMVFKMGKYKGR
jgi:protease-4